MERKRVVGDALYGYVPLSRLEHILIGQRDALRLHRVLQNSTAYHTFPNNQGSRFSHSIGAMHVAGQLFRVLAQHDDVGLLAQLREPIETLASKALIQLQPTAIQAYLDRDLDPLYREAGWTSSDWLTIIAFQATRFAAMVHDIGHPPYSHVVEYALNDRGLDGVNGSFDVAVDRLWHDFRQFVGVDLQSKPALHEMVGLMVTKKSFADVQASNHEDHAFSLLCLYAAAEILIAEQLGHYSEISGAPRTLNDDRLLPWYALGQLVSGEIDCDRLDYLRRDPLNAGVSDFGQIDINRVIDNIKPAIVRRGNKQIITLSFDHRAVSALETVLYERLRQFRWLISHHNVVRTDNALNRLVYELIELHGKNRDQLTKPEETLVEALDAHGFPRLWEWHSFADWHRTEDAWLETMLFDLHHIATGLREDSTVDHIRTLLDVVLFRRVHLLRSLWKRLDQFLPFAEGFTAYFEERQTHFRRLWGSSARTKSLVDALKSLKRELDGPFARVRFVNALIRVLAASARIDGVISIQRRLEQGVYEGRFRFVWKNFVPYKGVLVRDTENHGQVTDLREMSSLVENLDRLWFDGLTLFAFDTHTTSPQPDLEDVGRAFASTVDEYLFRAATPKRRSALPGRSARKKKSRPRRATRSR